MIEIKYFKTKSKINGSIGIVQCYQDKEADTEDFYHFACEDPFTRDEVEDEDEILEEIK